MYISKVVKNVYEVHTYIWKTEKVKMNEDSELFKKKFNSCSKHSFLHIMCVHRKKMYVVILNIFVNLTMCGLKPFLCIFFEKCTYCMFKKTFYTVRLLPQSTPHTLAVKKLFYGRMFPVIVFTTFWKSCCILFQCMHVTLLHLLPVKC